MTLHRDRGPARCRELLDVRRHELDEIAAFVRANQSVALIGPPGAGKTTLLVHLAGAGTLGQESLVVYLDCGGLRDQTYEGVFAQWTTAMQATLAARGLLPEPTLAEAAAQPARLAMETAVRRLNQRGLRLALILDEFEQLSGNPRLGVSFFNGLRSLAGRYELVFLTASVRPLIDLTYAGCAEEIASSPFFNIFASIRLGPSRP